MFRNHISVIFLLYITSIFFVACNSNSKGAPGKRLDVPPCRACKIFVESFKKGLERTKTGKFEGGDAAWEEEKLGSYAKSEIRLIEIQEKVCSDVQEGKDQCYSILEQHDTIIEDWWLNKQNNEPDIYKYLCIETIQHCCPDLHYGPECTPCEGYPDNVCSGSGKCKGAGTRKGNGKCSCEPGYDGAKCEKCASDHYESYRDEKKLLCTRCHTACADSCTKAGAEGCSSCAPGWLMSPETGKGCLDINECAASTSPCRQDQFCVNNDGSYRCLDCDRACAGCTGDGPDMCIKCAPGYLLVDNMCIDSEQEDRKQHVFLTRYLTYLGLCIATCIIFNKNMALAAIIGLAVAVYISVSEYILNTPPTPKTDDIAQQLFGAKKLDNFN